MAALYFRKSIHGELTPVVLWGEPKHCWGDGQVYAGGPHHFLAMDQRNGDVGEAYINGRQMALANDQAFILTGEKFDLRGSCQTLKSQSGKTEMVFESAFRS